MPKSKDRSASAPGRERLPSNTGEPARLRRLKFIKEYLRDFNGAKAAIRAGYSPDSARQEAHRLLTNADVKRVIEQTRAELIDGIAMEKGEAIAVLSERARGDITDYSTMSEDGVWTDAIGPESPNTKAIKKMTSHTIADKDGDTQRIVKTVEIHDGNAAIATLARIQGWDKAQVEISATDDLLAALAGVDGAAKGPPAARASK